MGLRCLDEGKMKEKVVKIDDEGNYTNDRNFNYVMRSCNLLVRLL